MLADGRMKNITNVISLDAYLEFFGRWDMYLQTATVF